MTEKEEKKLKGVLERRALKNSEAYVLEQLTEGLLFSYSIDKFEPFLKKVFSKLENDGILKNSSFARFSDPKNDIDVLDVTFEPLDNEFFKNKELLKKELHDVWKNGFDLHGWIFGSLKKIRRNGNDSIVASFEPKFPLENKNVDRRTKEEIEKFKLFYHVSFPKYEKKILEHGLVPSISHRKDFMYPERIYLFGREMLANVFADYHFKNPDGMSHKFDAQILRVKNGKNRKNRIADLKFQTIPDDILVFEVDLEKMLKEGNKKIRLYHDNRFLVGQKYAENDGSSAAFFTYNQIDPKYVKLKYRFNVHDSIEMEPENNG